MVEYTAKDALRILAETEMKPFDQIDFHAFAGVNSVRPLIGYHMDTWIVVVDDETLTLMAVEDIHSDEEHVFELTKVSAD